VYRGACTQLLRNVVCPVSSTESSREIPDVLLVKRKGEAGNAGLCRAAINSAAEFAWRNI